MKIQYDHQTFSLQQYGGISRYFSAIQDYVQGQENMTMDRGILVSRNHYLPLQAFPIPPKWGRALVGRSRTYSLNKKYCRFLIKKNEFDIFHPTYYDSYFLPVLKKPFVLTVHDMNHELFPEFFPQNDPFITYKRKVIEKADHIIAISESTGNDLKNIFRIKDDKVSVIHHGFYNKHLTSGTDLGSLPNRFLLYVGNRNGYKNFTGFVSAISPLLQREIDLFLICGGGGEFSVAERELLIRSRLSDRVIQIPVDDLQLKTLYQKAMLFVFPSLYEGFGLPLLEAFSNNCPVAVSNTGCFPEVGGDAVVYFNPYEPEDILQTIDSTLNNTELKMDILLKAKERLKNFSLDECMQKTINVYQKLAYS